MSEPADHGKDPFPREQAVELVQRLPAYARLALALGRDTRLPASQRAALIGAGTYVLSPVGLIPGFIPLAGQLDDLWVLLRAIRFALRSLPPVTRAEYLADAGIDEQDIEEDHAAVSDLMAWTARRARATATRAAARGLRAGRKLAAGADRLRSDVARRLQDRRSSHDG